MKIEKQDFYIRELNYRIRSAIESDAENLAEIRLQIDGETENLDREKGEDYLNTEDFQKIIQQDTKSEKNLFLVAVVQERIVGYSRCEGSHLKRFSHKAEFGICILKEFWGYGIGKNLLSIAMSWADSNEIKKITLNVLETNEKAIQLYKSFDFEVEGVLKRDKVLSDGNYYNTIIMGRIHESLFR